MSVFQTYLDQNDITRYQVGKAGNIYASTLKNISDKDYPVEKLSNRVVIAIAACLDKTPGTVLDELIDLEKDLAK